MVISVDTREGESHISYPIEHNPLERKANKVAVIFPGQNIRALGMFDEVATHAAGREVLKRGNVWLKEHYNFDIVDMAKTVEGETAEETVRRANKLRQTQYTQPAVYLLSMAIHNINKHHKHKEGYATIPEAVTGVSQGMGIAAVIAGYMNFETGLFYNAERGRIMQEFGSPTPTSQVTLVGNGEAVIEYLNRPENKTLDLCIINGDKLWVVGGPDSGNPNDTDSPMQRVRREATSIKGISKILEVDTDRALHGRYVSDARPEFDAMLDKIPFQKPHSLIISSITSGTIKTVEAMKEELKAGFDGRIDNRLPVRYLHENGYHIIYEVGNNKGFLARVIGDHVGTLTIVGGVTVAAAVGAAEYWTHHHPRHPKNGSR